MPRGVRSHLTRDDALSAIRRVAADLGRAPSRREFLRRALALAAENAAPPRGPITQHVIDRCFESWNDALREAGLDPHSKNQPVEIGPMLEQWGTVVRALGHLPTRAVYRREGGRHTEVLQRACHGWKRVPAAFTNYAKDKPEWADVLRIIERARAAGPKRHRALIMPRPAEPFTPGEAPRSSRLTDRAALGDPLDFEAMRHEPVNEQGVVLLFGMLAERLGYLIETVQTAFPDCEAKRRVAGGRWQRVRIEFEFESRAYQEHGHPAENGEACDVIVCWRHTWAECPEWIEVLELRAVVERLGEGRGDAIEYRGSRGVGARGWVRSAGG